MSRKVATIGFFDGVHKGHQFLIRYLRQVALERGARSVIVTMYPHPKAVLTPEQQPLLLTTLEEKMALLAQTGVDDVQLLHFDFPMSQLSAQEFMSEVLRKQLDIDFLLMGYDHKFGHGGGSFSDYVAWGNELQMEVKQVPKFPDAYVSSSAIRKKLSTGDVEQATLMLGHPYTLHGKVVEGFQVGRTLGFPTANLKPDAEKLLPSNGVYAVWAVLPGGKRYMGMLNIGNRPTLDNGGGISIEVNLLGFSGNLYGQNIRLELVQHLRNEMRFGTLPELQAQLRRDAEKVKCLLR